MALFCPTLYPGTLARARVCAAPVSQEKPPREPDAANNVTTYGYDTESNLTGITDANNQLTTFTYDAFGRVTRTSFPSTLIETYAYDADDNLTSKTDRKNQTITYTYDQLNRLAGKTYPDSTKRAGEYTPCF